MKYISICLSVFLSDQSLRYSVVKKVIIMTQHAVSECVTLKFIHLFCFSLSDSQISCSITSVAVRKKQTLSSRLVAYFAERYLEFCCKKERFVPGSITFFPP